MVVKPLVGAVQVHHAERWLCASDQTGSLLSNVPFKSFPRTEPDVPEIRRRATKSSLPGRTLITVGAVISTSPVVLVARTKSGWSPKGGSLHVNVKGLLVTAARTA